MKTPRWFRPEDKSDRFQFDRDTGRITPPDREASGEEPVLLYASGDIIRERDLQKDVLEQPEDHPLGKVREIWADGDVVFAQLETCFGPERSPHLKHKRISYLTDPGLVPHFVAGGFNLACLASNHTMDNGLEPIRFTRRTLAEHGIATSGSGANLSEARKPAIIEAKGRKIALLSYASHDVDTNAGPDHPGNAPFHRELVIEDVIKARAVADFVLVSVHRGREFVGFPSLEHQADCRAIVDAGADVILGHHPHFMQGIEWRKGPEGSQAVIFYSLGSLLVDYEPHLSRYELELFQRSQRNNIVARVELDGRGVSGIGLTPIRQTEDWSVRRETEAEAQDTWNFVEWTSHPVNHEELCRKFWLTGWPYMAIQYPSMWMHLKSRPGYVKNIIRWFFREESFRLHWGTLFGREAPEWTLALRRGIHALLRAPFRLIKRILGKGAATGSAL